MVAETGKPINLGGTAIKPEGWDRTGWESIKYTIYDPKTGAVFTRTPLSWLKITTFYIIYYSCLAGFWLGCLTIFFMTLPEGKPRWVLDGSLIGTNPGVGRRPGNDDKRIDSSIVFIEATSTDLSTTDEDGEGVKNGDWAKRMELFMKRYDNTTNLVDCSGDSKGDGKCIFDTSILGECKDFPYGYVRDPTDKYVKPCIFLKFNKIWDWVPSPLDPSTLDDPKYEEMSESLKTKIRGAADTDYVWMDCQGRYPADNEAFSVTYYPENQGISTKFFPYTGGNYHAPLVAVRLETDRISELQIGQLIHIECKAWYDGVVHSSKEMAGLVRFEVILSSNPYKED